MVKIISPFALATAYFAMPPAVIPFNLTHRAFIIFTLVIMAVLALLFVITETAQNWKGWNKRFGRYMKSIQLEKLRVWVRGSRNPPIPKRSQSGLQTDQPWISNSSV